MARAICATYWKARVGARRRRRAVLRPLAKQLLTVFGAEIAATLCSSAVSRLAARTRLEQSVLSPMRRALRSRAEAQLRCVVLVDEKRRAGDTLGGVFEVVAQAASSRG